MLAVRLLLFVMVAVAACCALGLELGRPRLARIAIRMAGLIHGHRRSEYLGELAMLQAQEDESGLDYAVGAVFSAAVERITIGKPLSIDNVTKTLGGTRALDTVSLNVSGGSITALVGANGAGKSTLINLITGVQQPDVGSITFGGVDVAGQGGGGIAYVRHELELFPDLDVAQNLSLCSGVAGYWFVNRRAEHSKAAAALARIGASVDTHARVWQLDQADRCLVAIARAVQTGCELLVLDEPSAKLTPMGRAKLLQSMDHVRSLGVGIIFASHCLDHVFQLADRVAVLRDGRLVHESAIVDTDADELVRHIVGSGDEAQAA